MILRFLSSYRKLHYTKRQWAEDGVVKIESLTNKTMEGALKVIRDSFFKTEPLCKAVGLLEEPGAAEELMQTCYDAAKDGVTLVASDTSTNEIIGVVFNKIQVTIPKEENYYEKLRRNCKHRSVRAFLDFSIDLEMKANIHQRYDTNCFIEVMYLATLPDFKHKNVGSLLGLCTYDLGKKLFNGEDVKTPLSNNEDITNFEAIPNLLVALTTSKYTQRMGVKFGYEKVVEVRYDDYSYNGKSFRESIGDEHQTCQVLVKRLDK
ncbi:hypothetical protein HW555_013609 [Spodoptera exigua]|uniref:N-acetyltransferase domain-containing protein n=1 Tax=Spodoptera exigua TaxID=7107 RepID=A0A835KZM7_SPOEX|nr:hypothetical protein HW555_013609 [Spodoptera exigua]